MARLFVEGQATLDGARGGTALEAIQKELAAQQIARHPDTGPLFKAMKLTGGLVKAFGVDPSVSECGWERVATDGPSGFQVRDTSSGEAVPPCGIDVIGTRLEPGRARPCRCQRCGDTGIRRR